MHRAFRLLLRGLGWLIAIASIAVVVLALIPASTPPIAGPRPIASLEAVRIGGVEQWLLLRGADRSKPVLLYVHGGPGSAFIPLAKLSSERLERDFVVVHWDQRGAGKSCSSDVPNETLRLDRYVADTLEVVDWLRRRFHTDRVYLVGHSWGSVLGVLAVQRAPDSFHAYIGIGQVVNMRRGEEISYQWVLERARDEANEEALNQLRALSPPYTSLDELRIQRSWLSHYRGDVHRGGAIGMLLRAILTSPEYTLADKLSYYGCVLNSLEHVWFDLEQIDFLRSAPSLDVPVHLFVGRHDYNTPFELVVEWAEMLRAPRVELVWFEESAHMAPIEEPDRFRDELIGIRERSVTPDRKSLPQDAKPATGL